ncbi:G-type lectin S-receptor-like serine/threonine-protein kinase LECRK3 [Neltuma alba]|uniref:G-type lectin S-receptor-like serine/threonine-protein kinase LECRK3 n=1 Tax=Neltuma alba TaxID=207710 RepID=UPI0010A54226|nr:G-type lectin S-receptor-like serine/threonine-protein kinase LECRK3 [Prosopis alba]
MTDWKLLNTFEEDLEDFETNSFCSPVILQFCEILAAMATAASNIYFLLLVSFLCGRFETGHANQIIKLGASLCPVRPSSWSSPSGQFSFGFYHQGNGFKVGIWLFDGINKTIVWTANRDDPPVSSSARLVLTMRGELLLQTSPGQQKVIAHSKNGTVSSASMLDFGNFVLRDKNSNIIWQSFDYPTDTMLGGQLLPSGSQLVSSSSDTNHSAGRFQLSIQHDGNLALRSRYSGDTSWDAYWASQTRYDDTVSKYQLFLNNIGPYPLCIVNVTASSYNEVWPKGKIDENYDLFPSDNLTNIGKIIYRLTLHSDGILRLYAHFDNGKGKHQVEKLWSPSILDDLCNVKTFCGFNSYCTTNDDQPYCNCIPGTDFIDPSQTNLGCKRNFSEAECRGGENNAALYSMSAMSRMAWGDSPYSEEEIQEEQCQSSCLKDCYCAAALYEYGRCKKQKLPLRYVKRQTRDPSSTTIIYRSGSFTEYTTIYFKVGNQSLKSNYTPSTHKPINTTSKKAIVQIIVVVFGFAIVLCSVIAISGRLIYKIGVLSYRSLLEMRDLGLNEGTTLRVFSYNELKKATNGFKQEAGRGSSGSVYRGTLREGRKLIAVKMLHRLIDEGEREFQAEMQAIGKTHHKNLVRLLGYCAEGSKRLLVYEYMSNGSLEKFIFGGSTVRPDWDERRRIALDIARGLLYLHEQCSVPIIHCDIKPQNILMDEFLTAKISDFGLAKLLMPDQTRTFTQARGTRGYLAPEWSKNTPITVKADVYSYGIMLLEIVFCRRSLVVNVSNPEQIVLSNWVCKCFARRELNKLVVGEEVDNNLLENMVKVGLWCIQDEPFLRPSMKSVVLMLEGVTEVAIPPCPSSDSI